MSAYVNYAGKRVEFALPSGWNVISGQDRPAAPVVKDPVAEIARALNYPIGSGKIEDLARPGMEVVLLFDDLQRPTPAHIVLPKIMDRLNKAGIPDERIRAVCAPGTHHMLSLEQLKTKVGNEAFSRLEGRLLCHDPHAKDNVIIGRTHRGTLVEINKYVAFADLIIGVGECMPHPIAGYGGSFKLVMPGVCSYRAVADHHFTWMRHPKSRVNVLEGNHFKEYAERFKVFHVTEGLSAEQVKMMKYQYASTMQEAVNQLAREMPKADVAVLPSGGNIIAEVR